MTLLFSGFVPLVAQQHAAAVESPFASGSVVLDGHGWGHGRGMGQWGAYGYAKQGWSAEQILTHFYSGTTWGSTTNDQIRVRLDSEDASDTVVIASASGAGFKVIANAEVIGESTNPACPQWRAVLVGSTYNIECRTSGGAWSIVRTGMAGPVLFLPNATVLPADFLQLVYADGTRTYRGWLWAQRIGSTHRSINSLPMEDYLRGVVPKEVSGSWGATGGMAALEAQSIAARTYAAALKAYALSLATDPGYDVCTSTCQSYGGYALGSVVEDHVLSDQAIATTAGRVLLYAGKPILAEYSSSTGGYTAAGSASQPYFVPVVDAGDTYSPDHNWTSTIPVSAIEARYAIGSLTAIEVLSRAGYGEWGGRVKDVKITGTTGFTTVTGGAFRTAFDAYGFRSSWFKVRGVPCVPGGGVNGYMGVDAFGSVSIAGAASSFGDMTGITLNKPIVGMAVTSTGKGYWLVASDGGIFSFGDAVFYGSTGAMVLNKPIVGMAVTPTGKGYWLVATDGGIFSFGDAIFHGSTGAMVLNKPVLGMAVAPGGAGYWMVASDGGIFSFGTAKFHGSAGALTLGVPISGMATLPGGDGYWLVLANGGVLVYGAAPDYGSPDALGETTPAVELVSSFTGKGYLVMAADGTATAFGDFPSCGAVVPLSSGAAMKIVGALATK